MNGGFWDKLRKPILALAPMADVTDAVFRRLVAKKGKPDVMFTEFVVADGLMHPVGRERLLVDLRYSEIERPIVAQIWGGKPDNIEGAARLVRELGFDGVDINMGCPDKGVEKQDGGAGLIRHHDLARQIIDAAMHGTDGAIPVSVKTRIGYNTIDLEWIKLLMNSGIAALTLHLRTRKEMSKVPAHWELIPELLGELRGRVPVLAPSDVASGDMASRVDGDMVAPLVIGNGDVRDLVDAREKVAQSGADGAMLGRAIFGNPWLFAENGKPDWPEVFETIVEHSRRFEEEYLVPRSLGGVGKNFAIMRKFFGAYVAGLPSKALAKSGHPSVTSLKLALMECATALEVEAVLKPLM